MADEELGISLRACMEQGVHLTVYAPILKQDTMLELKLHGIEQGGIWVENQTLTDIMLDAAHETSLPSTPIFFVPYSSIRWAFVMADDLPSLSSRKLGL